MAVSRSRRTFSVPIPLRVALRVPRGSTRATPAPSGPRRSQTPLTPASSRRVRFPGSCFESLAVNGLGGKLTATTYIQRVNTAGGIAPVTGCKSAKDTGKKALVHYKTDYVFYR